jgi:hypothetical protein
MFSENYKYLKKGRKSRIFIERINRYKTIWTYKFAALLHIMSETKYH